jgi:hypothetical protein
MSTLSGWTNTVGTLNSVQLAPRISEEVFNNPIQLQEPDGKEQIVIFPD